MTSTSLYLIAGLVVAMQGATLTMVVNISTRITDLGDRVSRLEGISLRQTDLLHVRSSNRARVSRKETSS